MNRMNNFVMVGRKRVHNGGLSLTCPPGYNLITMVEGGVVYAACVPEDADPKDLKRLSVPPKVEEAIQRLPNLSARPVRPLPQPRPVQVITARRSNAVGVARLQGTSSGAGVPKCVDLSVEPATVVLTNGAILDPRLVVSMRASENPDFVIVRTVGSVGDDAPIETMLPICGPADTRTPPNFRAPPGGRRPPPRGTPPEYAPPQYCVPSCPPGFQPAGIIPGPGALKGRSPNGIGMALVGAGLGMAAGGLAGYMYGKRQGAKAAEGDLEYQGVQTVTVGETVKVPLPVNTSSLYVTDGASMSTESIVPAEGIKVEGEWQVNFKAPDGGEPYAEVTILKEGRSVFLEALGDQNVGTEAEPVMETVQVKLLAVAAPAVKRKENARRASNPGCRTPNLSPTKPFGRTNLAAFVADTSRPPRRKFRATRQPNDHLGGSSMTRGQLRNIGEYATYLHDLIGMTDRLPQWVEAKVSRATSNISSVKHFLEEQAYLQQTGQSFDVPLSNVPLDLGGVDPRRGPRLRNGPIEGAHMTKQNLKHVGDYAIYLYDLVSPTDSMPQWVEHLVTTSLNDIAHVKHFLEYQAYLQREGQPSYLTLTGPAAALPAPQEPQT